MTCVALGVSNPFVGTTCDNRDFDRSGIFVELVNAWFDVKLAESSSERDNPLQISVHRKSNKRNVVVFEVILGTLIKSFVSPVISGVSDFGFSE